MNILRFVIPKSLVEFVYEGNTVRQALEKMRYHRYRAIPVLAEDGRYVGTLRNEDVFDFFMERGATDLRTAERSEVKDILDRDYSHPLSHNAPAYELFELVKEHNFVPIVDDRGCFIGIILRRDVMNYLLRFYPKDED